MEWFRKAGRDLPWRRTRDPYAIWVSEVMLQQTRVTTVIPYYERFLQRFPSIAALASADDADVLAAWAGLGYYSRVRNMRAAAQRMNGEFPATYDGIRALPGIGDYTAAAVGSIAFSLPYAAVDGNVLRVLSRISGDTGDISAQESRKRISALAQLLLDRDEPGTYNEAIMELGATVCLPRAPQCLMCPLNSLCAAYRTGMQNRIPVKGRSAPARKVARVLYIAKRDDRTLFWRRPVDSQRLAGFWELPEREHLKYVEEGEALGTFKHAIVNHRYTIQVRESGSVQMRDGVDCAWLTHDEVKSRPLSTIARKALRLVVPSL